uniref:Phosphoribosylamine--glycine ligase n=1 Tax=Candidatus Kentrum eta TaxID=2126337 RepID=A0A450V8S5_9GAMM|nr:MAG: phosphoribosylamine--glycine ligase [Candidatus Kentron sp. H]VFJ94556.1 MAG: phosphoribosylamine--glycine ligase [Candidatus Kentron sp. H]VFK01097.1 MAG: phosphoribosylamine--glycine ligase [Candidatus Kentron sp. H]
MKILIIGSGGREHALAWKAAQSTRVTEIHVAPGNAGTTREPKVRNAPIGVGETPKLLAFAKAQKIDLTLVGPEAPLVAGIVDAFQGAGLRCFGPTREAARLEGSKAFTKEFLVRHGIPSAESRDFIDMEKAERYIRARFAVASHRCPRLASHAEDAACGETPIVIKADGLAAGKGVVIPRDFDQALTTARAMLSGKAFGEAGRRILVEEYLAGEEASFIALVDGEHILPMATSQDHKPRDAGDRGPNTGGMGAYSPAPVVTREMHDRIMGEIMEPTVAGMAADGRPYRGFLYAGLMIGEDGGPRVLEYNCRLGDPETQPILMRLESDLVALCEAAMDGALDRCQAKWDPRAGLGVVMASKGYPGAYPTGEVIRGLDTEHPHTKVFHAGTREVDGKVVTAGGRVLCVCALGETVTDARAAAYGRVREIRWENPYYRADIGFRAVGRGSSPL